MRLFGVMSQTTLGSVALVLVAACANPSVPPDGTSPSKAPVPALGTAAPSLPSSAPSPAASASAAPPPSARIPRCEQRRDCIGAPSACERERDCPHIRDGFAGLTIANLCGPLMPPPEVPAPYQSEMPLRARFEFPDSGFQCAVTQMKGELCQVVCDANAPWSAAEALVAWIADRYGRYNQRTNSGGMRTWAWSEPDDYFEVERLGTDPARPFLRVTASLGRSGRTVRLEYAVHFERATLLPLKR